MAGQVDEGDDLGALLADTHPVEVAVIGFVDDGAGAVEAEDVVAHRAGPPRLGLVFVSGETFTHDGQFDSLIRFWFWQVPLCLIQEKLLTVTLVKVTQYRASCLQ